MSRPNGEHDVFLSYSAKDKAVVRSIAERLEHSRVLVLCMSANAFGSEWSRLESYTFRFRDPLNKDRRFIPLRLDDAPIKGSLAQFSYINWLPEHREDEYPKLLEACRRPEPENLPDQQAARERLEVKIRSLGHTARVQSVAWSPDGQHALSGSDDNTVRLWEVESGHCLRVLEGHTASVLSVAWSPDGQRALSGSDD